MSYYRQQLEDWLQKLAVDAPSVFDVGGAQGEVSSRCFSFKCRDYKVLDLPEYDLQRPDNTETDRAQIVFCLEVFDYIKDPVMAFENLYKLTMLGGTIYATFPFIYPHHNELEAEGLRYSEQSIRWLAEKSKLKIKSIAYRIDKSGLLQSFYSADGMHPAKEYHHHNVTGFIVEFQK